MARGGLACRLAAMALGTLLAGLAMPPLEAASASQGARRSKANAPARLARQSRLPARAPSGPPLLSPASAVSTESTEAAGASSPAGEADPLVSNGLGSPTCASALVGELSSAPRRNCETSGFIGAAAPTGNYGIDVHIDTGVLGLSSGGLLSTVQDLLVTPVWMALVWIVHALIVMLEWCFTLDLLGDGSGLAGALATAQRYLTAPWLPMALSVAAVLIAYEGLVRRRVAESLGQAVLVLLMIGGGLWVMLNPAGTIGALSGWTNRAGLGTLAVAARGTPVAPGRALGASMSGLFAATVEGPWCYLEFGDVRWCRDPAMLDGTLKQAGLKIATEELSQDSCHTTSGCPGPVERSARLLREAKTNGEVFLALPSNGPARNSINSQTSLLHALCESGEATNCSASTAAQAEFRTNSGTWARVGGLLLILIGVLGMLLLLGHIGLRLLLAAMLSLFYLLLAPGIVLAPALGERGRALFRAWCARLFGAVVSKLIFAFLLGVVLAVMTVIDALSGLGWWTQWLLLAAFWWGLFLRRNHLLGGASSLISGVERQRRTSISRRAAQVVERPLRQRVGERIARRRSGPPPDVRPDRTAGPRALPLALGADTQALKLLMHARSHPRRSDRQAAPGESHLQEQLKRITFAHAGATVAGDSRRAARLAVRRARVATALEDDRSRSSNRTAPGRTGHVASTEDHARFLDAQAQLPRWGAPDESGRRRDYAALAPLADIAPSNYQQLAPGAQRAARLAIDRELAARQEDRAGQPRVTRPPSAQTPRARRGHNPVGLEIIAEPPDVVRAERRRNEPDPEVWNDIREVEAGRKRQLGIGRP